MPGNVIPFSSGSQYLSLEGITFRCSPSGSDGCP